MENKEVKIPEYDFLDDYFPDQKDNYSREQVRRMLMGYSQALKKENERLKSLIDDLLRTGYSGLQDHEQKEFISNYKTENQLQ